ncbi:MAG: SAM-dependent DNA methyltransferase [Bacteroidales bacterium]|nr:SAM-dependent DNA methyltransferase [Bacteroidales bacterium]
MLTGQLKNEVDKIWKEFWQNGMTDSLSIIKQITYLLFIRELDKQQTLKEKQANKLKMDIIDPIYSEEQRELRWSVFKDKDPETMFRLFRKENGIFDFIRNIGADGGIFAATMKYANFEINSPKLLDKVVQLLDAIKMDDKDTKGDLYEYLLSKLSSAGINGQFRTPRHIIKMMVEMMQPQPDDFICDPACGTAGFLVASAEYMNEKYSDKFYDKDFRDHYNSNMFNGFENDTTMLGVGAMNLQMHGITDPQLMYMDALSDGNNVSERYSLMLANPPFSGTLDYSGVETSLKKMLRATKTSENGKTELLFLALMLRALKAGGRAAVVVPAGVLFGSTNSHKALRQALIDENQLQAVISMPSGVFKPYTGVATAILVFTKTGTGGTDKVWFYDMKADGYSLDDKRDETIDKNDIPDIIEKYRTIIDEKIKADFGIDRTANNFFVPVDDIRAEDYNLSFNLYQEIVYEEVKYDNPKDIINGNDKRKGIRKLDQEREQLMKELEGLLK